MMKIIARNVLGEEPVVLDDSYTVEFGDGKETICVSIDSRGRINVFSPHQPIRVEPRAANVIWVSVKKEETR